MNPKRKRLYLILIVVCILASAGVFLWGRNTTTPPPIAQTNPLQPTAPVAKIAPVLNPDGTYSAPAVFPANEKLDIQLLDSSAFKVLQTYQPAQLEAGDLGREDPFKNY